MAKIIPERTAVQQNQFGLMGEISLEELVRKAIGDQEIGD